ncbi:hypothetical protein N0V88_007291 [Collariella sp. IMI 366227]|nr:hypothetical protein N0V88_007291 [Collariella sp. IMI 366227]
MALVSHNDTIVATGLNSCTSVRLHSSSKSTSIDLTTVIPASAAKVPANMPAKARLLRSPNQDAKDGL